MIAEGQVVLFRFPQLAKQSVQISGSLPRIVGGR